ncbi:hypothetical protein [Hymenobacter negativus]|uniref:hypothetical protein n=1 Tax=Hymenobacter negativus TaxID=2795026 RepID=UPI001AAEC4A2|nr:hypothetical protein [Hymenobacter negativus]
MAVVNLLLYPPTQPGAKEPEDTSLGEALESCFPYLLDGARLHWNGVPVPLSYKYDLSIVVHNVVGLVRQLRTVTQGSFSICWPSNTFHASWLVEMAAGRVRVTASWHSVSAQDGPLEEALNAVPVVEAEQAAFMAQWVALLRLAHQYLIATGYTLEELEDYGPLLAELAHHR